MKKILLSTVSLLLIQSGTFIASDKSAAAAASSSSAGVAATSAASSSNSKSSSAAQTAKYKEWFAKNMSNTAIFSVVKEQGTEKVLISFTIDLGKQTKEEIEKSFSASKSALEKEALKYLAAEKANADLACFNFKNKAREKIDPITFQIQRK